MIIHHRNNVGTFVGAQTLYWVFQSAIATKISVISAARSAVFNPDVKVVWKVPGGGSSWKTPGGGSQWTI